MRKYIIAAVFTALSLLIYGYDYGTTINHIQILPFFYKLANPSLFHNDYYVDTLSLFPSIYLYINAFLLRWFSLEKLYLPIYVVCKYLLLIFAYQLSYFLFPSRKTALFTVFLFATSSPINLKGLIGNDPLIKSCLFQTSLIAPFAVLCVLMFLRKKYKSAAAILAGIYYLNALVGNYIFVMFSFAWFNIFIQERNRDSLKKAFLSVLLFSFLVLPGLLWVIKTNIAHPQHYSPYFAIWLKNWYSGHYFLLDWGLMQWTYVISICVCFLIFFREGFRTCAHKDTVRSFLFGLFFLWLLAFLFGDILPVRRVILLQFFRSDMFFIAFGCVFAANYISTLISRQTVKHLIIASLFILAITEYNLPRSYGAALAVFILYNYSSQLESLLARISRIPGKLLLAAQKAFLVSLILIAIINYFVYYNKIKTVYFIILLLFLLITGQKTIPLKLQKWVTALIILFSLLPHILSIRYAFVNKTLSKYSTQQLEVERDWKAAQVWARENTAINSVFIVPVNMHGFRVYSQRPVFTEWTDGAAMHWSAGFEDIWVSRLEKLGFTRQEMLQNHKSFGGLGRYSSGFEKEMATLRYAEQGEQVFSRIKDEYGASYVVEAAWRQLNFPLVYENHSFRIYRIP